MKVNGKDDMMENKSHVPNPQAEMLSENRLPRLKSIGYIGLASFSRPVTYPLVN